MSEMEAMSRHAMQRAEVARQRAQDFQQCYQYLTAHPGATAEQVQHARRAAMAARGNAEMAHQCLLEQLNRSAAIHQLAADAHDKVAAVAHDRTEKLGHIHAAERHRAAARRDAATAAQLSDTSIDQIRLTPPKLMSPRQEPPTTAA